MKEQNYFYIINAICESNMSQLGLDHISCPIDQEIAEHLRADYYPAAIKIQAVKIDRSTFEELLASGGSPEDPKAQKLVMDEFVTRYTTARRCGTELRFIVDPEAKMLNEMNKRYGDLEGIVRMYKGVQI